MTDGLWRVDQLTFWSEERPASPSASPGSEPESLESVEDLRLSFYAWLESCGLGGSSGKTSPASCRRTEDGRWEPLSGGWRNSGMGSPGECWTLSTSEWTDTLVPSPSAAGVSSLSDILVETRDVPGKFYLSRRACEGILRRAEKRGKTLPEHLARALRAVADSAPTLS